MSTTQPRRSEVNDHNLSTDQRLAKLRRSCSGVPKLDARVEPWMTDLLSRRRKEIDQAIAKFGSPLNVIQTDPLKTNIGNLDAVAAKHQISFRVFFARKANKCLSLVDAAANCGAGIDVASEQECVQALSRSLDGENLICTAAIKTRPLLQLCIERGVTIAVDNADELSCIRRIARESETTARCAIRFSGFHHDGEKLQSRFGFDTDDAASVIDLFGIKGNSESKIVGLHFHLDGYCPKQRVSAISQCLPIVDKMREMGHSPEFLDIGGGIPMSYLKSENQWDEFWSAHSTSLLGNSAPCTYRNHGLGRVVVNSEIHGTPNVYPYFQRPVQNHWLDQLLSAEVQCSDVDGSTVAKSIVDRDLQLRCEPGRSILDGCGMTIARVEFTKRYRDGTWFVGLAMNRTQCRTGSDDFLVDPIVLQRADMTTTGQDRSPKTGYLVGAYCTEFELIQLRKLDFPQGIERGDLVAIPNTAGYLMHFMESRSHQFPLAKNLVSRERKGLSLDDIDCADS